MTIPVINYKLQWNCPSVTILHNVILLMFGSKNDKIRVSVANKIWRYPICSRDALAFYLFKAGRNTYSLFKSRRGRRKR